VASALGQLLPMAVGIALSPIPIIAVVLMLLTPRAGATGAGFLLGWLVGIVVIVVVFAAIGSATTLVTGDDKTATGTVKVVLGVVLLALAFRRFRRKVPEGEQAHLPSWMTHIDKVTPVRAVALGFAVVAINPKNLALGIVAGMSLASAQLPMAQEAVVVLVYAVIAGCTVAIPVVGYAVARQRADGALTSLKAWLVEHNDAVMAVVLLLLGVMLIGKGLSAS